MRSLVVLFALVALAVAAPYGQLVSYQPQPLAYVVPGAVSHQSRVDYKAPYVAGERLVAAPFVAGGYPGGVPAFYSANPYFGGPLPYNYYGGQSLVPPFVAQGPVFAAY